MRVTSSGDQSLCQHMKKEESPEDFAGGDIEINHNGVKIATMERGLKFFQCWNQEDIDVSNDEFQLKSSDGDGTCITSLIINGNQLLIGKKNHGHDRHCLDDFMSLSQITFKNGQVISADCKSMDQDEVIHYSK